MNVKEVTDILEKLAPLGQAEDFDNVGLLVGRDDAQVTGILVTLDTLEIVIDEAIAHNCNLIVSFHPIIFGGLKKLTGTNYVERVVIKAIHNHLAIYSMHTALDNVVLGVNAKICEVLGIKKAKILIPKKGTIKKLTTYVPLDNAQSLKEALFEAGAGQIGNYSHCSFCTDGVGSFRAGQDAKPVKGKIGTTHYENETQLSVIFSSVDQKKILKGLFENHPYEEVAYEVYTLENTDANIGLGMIGQLEAPVEEIDFLKQIKQKMGAKGIRHSRPLGRKIKKIAVLGGSGAFAISAAKAAGAELFITADVKYHQFYQGENEMMIADIGHYETEQFTKNLLVDYLKEKIPNFAVRLSESQTNPINYL
jgi:dinuclear metal center YbgI/SA1388 family protein